MSCTHHWLIDRLPVEGKFHAVCKLCGAKRTFPITFSYGRAYGTKTASGRGGRGRRKRVLTEA